MKQVQGKSAKGTHLIRADNSKILIFKRIFQSQTKHELTTILQEVITLLDARLVKKIRQNK